MKKKAPEPASSGESAPLWVVSFADLASLLMAFFVMIASMSAGSSDDVKFRQLLKSLQEAFGSSDEADSKGRTPDPAEVIARLDEIMMQNFKKKNGGGEGDQQGLPGRQNTVTRIREGIEFTIGGLIGFEPGSADLREEAKTAIREICEYTRGENNKIEIRGHTTRAEAGPNAKFTDEHALAFARAGAVSDYLVQLGVRPERIRRVSCGSNEPLNTQAYDDQAKSANRRVEIIVNQSLAQQFVGEESQAAATPSVAPPGEKRVESPAGSAGGAPSEGRDEFASVKIDEEP